MWIGPGGDLFYAGFDGGDVRRISYPVAEQRAGVVVANASPATGDAPLMVSFNGTGSNDPDQGDTISYAWDLDGDGAFDDATTATAKQLGLHRDGHAHGDAARDRQPRRERH